MNNLSPENAAAAARHVKGSTIAWGGGSYFDLVFPERTTMTIRQYAFALAFTCRWRGQTFSSGREVMYSVCEHVVRGAELLMLEGYGNEHALAFLGHESDEVPFGDTPGPAKQFWSPEFREVVARCGEALDVRFGFHCPDPDLIKRWDIRMMVTEKRDLLIGFENDVLTTDGEHMADERYAPFLTPIIPFRHPADAAERFLTLYNVLTRGTA
jgi:hypothetical protein